ncbi:MAG: DUF1232 domain-containing protein [Bacteroidales bacterium]|nr:DUF1232 domain-containing protein [Bacteroidales bacterium]MCM1146637.1 DUF1232 domain-containing protein [Bacteroidales bacterium]MCM1206029.1 DUF1232 domain-containing protein [Bacillota bacterium]MCM1511070.1 DUF1232 domain-containing protein [Clostridium sp.]
MATFNLNHAALLESISNWSRKAGRAATRPVLLLWYVMRSNETPRADKWAIFCSLAYLVLPIDILDSKRLPVIGWLDEVTSLAVLVQKMSGHITPEMEALADEQLDKWFPEYAGYEMIEE